MGPGCGRPDLSVDIGGYRFKNPVFVASGIVGYGLEYTHLAGLAELGAVVLKGTTLEPRKGNPPPRLAETPCGLLNSVGLENPGVEEVVGRIAPELMRSGITAIANIAGTTVQEYRTLAEKFDECEAVAAIEVNVSCPNVTKGGMHFGVEPRATAEVVAAVRKATTKPVLVKLSPNAADIVKVAVAAEEAGADAVSLINTILGMAIDVESRRPVLGNVFGGLSGPAVKPIALRMVWDVCGAISIPVVGIGGISTARDALEFILAGASAVQIGTALFSNPEAAGEVLLGLETYLRETGSSSVAEIVGAARSSYRGRTEGERECRDGANS